MTDQLLLVLSKIVSADRHTFFPYIIDKYIRYEYELQPWFRQCRPKCSERSNDGSAGTI